MAEEQGPHKQARLAAAAEALVEAASLQTNVLTQKGLDASLNSNLNRVVQTMKSSNENFDAKINTVNQHLADMKSEMGVLQTEISAMKKVLQDERRDKRIERALKLTDLESFEYQHDCYTKKSSDLAKEVLGWLLLGYGYNLPDAMLDRYASGKEEATKKASFRTKFKNQIKDLIGHEPRLVEKEDGSYSIYYK